ncbi:MAG TPA: DUF1326 domain-containing protein [Thermoanaerobaculia bacterium]|nr:DUF1326 domain-containing protein [Thermoanaerobaculia bacterium]
MPRPALGLVVGAVIVLVLAALPAAAAVRGSYLEARTADVYGGPCTGAARGDGHAAILAWRIEEGDWGGVGLAGLSVVVVVRADGALGAKTATAAAAHSLILVDEGASASQRTALEALARAEAGAILGDVVAVQPAPIQLAIDPRRALGRLEVGSLAELRTRPFNRLDALCGDETLVALPLAQGVDATPAVALEHAFRSDALGSPWNATNRRGAFVGTFSR